MHRSIRLSVLTVLPLSCLLVLGACSQPGSSSGTPAPGVAVSPPVAAAAAATAPAAPSSAWVDERDFSVPTEKFGDAQRNFEAAKKALLEGYYSDALTEDDLYRAAVAGMLERVDPQMRKWNKLLSPSDLAELRNDLAGEIVGVGVQIELDPATGYIDVKGTIPGSPADRAGIAPPDKIVTVDGKLYRGLGVHDVVRDIRGKAGDSVTLSILRGDKLVSVPLLREKVVFDVVRDRIVGTNAGYLRIPSFNTKTPAAVHDALADLESKDARSLVVDLRENQGGLFEDAVASVGQMVPAGSTVVSVDKRGKVEPFVAKSATPLLLDRPVVVLVDHETASSAELVAAALQELRHATLVGAQTKGKWTVQRIEDLPNGYAMKFTVGMFQSPAGKSYEGKGMAPDVEVDEPSEAIARALMEKDPVKSLAADAQMRTALSVVGAGH
jgi:carboxyl-terminal processing protease